MSSVLISLISKVRLVLDFRSEAQPIVSAYRCFQSPFYHNFPFSLIHPFLPPLLSTSSQSSPGSRYPFRSPIFRCLSLFSISLLSQVSHFPSLILKLFHYFYLSSALGQKALQGLSIRSEEQIQVSVAVFNLTSVSHFGHFLSLISFLIYYFTTHLHYFEKLSRLFISVRMGEIQVSVAVFNLPLIKS